MMFRGGLNLKFISETEFESVIDRAAEEHYGVYGRNALRLLMMGWTKSWSELLSWPIFKAVFLQRDHALLKELRLAFQQGFDHLFLQLKDQQLTKEQHEQVQLYLSNCLSLLPYADLSPYESFRIPQYTNRHWELVDYEVKPIELTKMQGIEHRLLQDSDRVFAYGLEPITHPDAQSHLIFMGTTYPAGQGFAQQIKTDFKGFETVGMALYERGRQGLKDWLTAQKNKVHVCGVSLGGSLSLLLANDLGEHLSRVDVLNPAGLHDDTIKEKYDRWDDISPQPEVVVQIQGKDPVSFFGVWKKNWIIIRVTPPVELQGPNLFCDHFLNYAGFADTRFTYVTAEEENAQRKFRNFWLYSLGRSVFYYTTLVPYNYMVRPALYFFKDHWSSILLATAILLAVIACGILATAGVLPTAATGLIFTAAAVGSAVVLYKSVMWESNSFSLADKHALAKLHDPSLPRNPELDIHNNHIELNLSYKDLNAYYKIKRCLVKGKEFIPEHDHSGIFSDGSKKEHLQLSEHTENADKYLLLKVSKAKAIHIKHTLSFIEQLRDDEQALKQAIAEDYKHYCTGKSGRSPSC